MYGCSGLVLDREEKQRRQRVERMRRKTMVQRGEANMDHKNISNMTPPSGTFTQATMFSSSSDPTTFLAPYILNMPASFSTPLPNFGGGGDNSAMTKIPFPFFALASTSPSWPSTSPSWPSSPSFGETNQISSSNAKQVA